MTFEALIVWVPVADGLCAINFQAICNRAHRRLLETTVVYISWERRYAPEAVVTHHRTVTDRRFFTHWVLRDWSSVARFAPKHPDRRRGS